MQPMLPRTGVPSDGLALELQDDFRLRLHDQMPNGGKTGVFVRSNLTEAVRERCSLESITQPTWHSMGGLELCRVFLFLGVCEVANNIASGSRKS